MKGRPCKMCKDCIEPRKRWCTSLTKEECKK